MTLFLANCIFAVAQEVRVTGTVYESGTELPIPMASVVVGNTSLGTVADENGYFSLLIPTSERVLYFSAIGYEDLKFHLSEGVSTKLKIEMEYIAYGLEEIVILPTENPAHPILRKMVRNKPQNNPGEYPEYEYEKYQKWDYKLVNLGEKLSQSRMFRNHQEVLKKQEDGRYSLPVFFSEELSENQYQKEPLKRKHTLLAENSLGLSFLDDLEISGYVASMDVEVNFYDNYMRLFGKNFVSPLSNNGLFYYRYYLIDSTTVGDVVHYTLSYKPKRPIENVFFGEFVIESKNYSVVSIHAVLSPDANINFIQKLKFDVDYKLHDESKPFYSRSRMQLLIDYYPGSDTSGNRMSLESKVTSVFDKVKLTLPAPIELTAGALNYEKVKQKGYDQVSVQQWEGLRHEELNAAELSVRKNIDDINNIPMVKHLDRLAEMALTGYYDCGKIEIGPYLNFINFNRLEKLHLGLGARTSDEVSKNWLFWGELGYGFGDHKWKGAGGIAYKFPETRRRVINLAYNNTVSRIGGSDRILYLYENRMTPSEDNIISALFQRDTIDELSYEKSIALSYEHEWFSGFSSKLSWYGREHFSPPFYPFVQNGNPVSRYSHFEFTIDHRISFKERVLDKGNRRIYINSYRPVLHIVGGVGGYSAGHENGRYGRLHMTMAHTAFLGQAKLVYALETGMIVGRVPYTLLEFPRGNETFGYAKYKFNMMNNLEYVHDKYVHVYADYYLNGFFFSRFPFLKRMKFNEVLSFKMALGELSDKNKEVLELPDGLRGLGWSPYIELGAGVENVLRFFRFDLIWRVRPESQQYDTSLGIRAGFYIDF